MGSPPDQYLGGVVKLAQFGQDGRHDLVHVADHGVGRLGDHRGVGIARIVLEEAHPAQCWIAPEIPHGMYRSGEIREPV